MAKYYFMERNAHIKVWQGPYEAANVQKAWAQFREKSGKDGNWNQSRGEWISRKEVIE